MGEILPDGTIGGYGGYCQKCGKEIKVNSQGNEIGSHYCKESLFHKLKDVIPMGYKITMSNESLNLSITVVKTDNKGTEHHKESWLPLHDHFYEQKLVDCIEYMVNEIHKDIYP